MARLLSFDFGTGGVRAGVYCTDQRTMIATAQAAYATTYPKAGWAEQNCRQWIDAMVDAGSKVVAACSHNDIEAICVATTASTMVACRHNGEPVRDAILWMDSRASAEARQTETIEHAVMDYCGGSDAAEWLVPKAMWLSRHEPDQYQRADVVCEALDFINFHLTGQWVASRMNAACKWNYDSLQGRFVTEIYAQLGVPELADKLPAHIIPVGDPIGPAQAQLMAAMGIANRPLVAQGGIDAHIGMLGANTVAPGAMLVIGGTSVVHLTQLGAMSDMSGFWGPYPNALIDGLWLVEAGQVSAGSIISWLVDTMFGLDESGHKALMSEVAAGNHRGDGLLALDYWMGNRTPYRDADLRGALLGLTLGHSRADLYASVVDAVALGSANVISVLAQRNVKPERVVMAGGICNNPIWLQATVDALGQTVLVAKDDNLTLSGCAVCSATALGMFDSLEATSGAFEAAAEPVEPDLERSDWFGSTLGLYRQATEAVRPVMHELADRQRQEQPQ